jgi:Cys-rich protein (TIGR01571 family)
VADVIRQGDKNDGHRIPTGKWRDGLCDCFAHGICHPMLWLACLCRPLALGQIMTRMDLSATGGALPEAANAGTARAARGSAFKTMSWIFAVFLVVRYVLKTLWSPYKDHMKTTYDDSGHRISPDYEGVPESARVAQEWHGALAFAFFAFMLVALVRTRAHVRRRYGIPEHYCAGGLEDCCCAFWLPCCTTLQIARHTADYTKHPAACCTETGLLLPHHHHHHDFDPDPRPAGETGGIGV